MSSQNYDSASYFFSVLHPEERIEVLEKAVADLKDVVFDAIAFTGMSGALFAPMLAFAMKKELIAVRKSSADTHSHTPIEGYIKSKRYIIVDDFVSSGTTILLVCEKVKNFATDGKLVGILTYYDNGIYNESAGFYNSGSRIFRRLPKLEEYTDSVLPDLLVES